MEQTCPCASVPGKRIGRGGGGVCRGNHCCQSFNSVLPCLWLLVLVFNFVCNLGVLGSVLFLEVQNNDSLTVMGLTKCTDDCVCCKERWNLVV